MKRIFGIFVALLLILWISGCAHGTIETKAQETAIPITQENLAQLKGVWTGEITAITSRGPRSSTLEIHNDTLPLRGKFIHHPIGSFGTSEQEFDNGAIENGQLVIASGGARPAKVRMSLSTSNGMLSLNGEYVASGYSSPAAPSGPVAGAMHYQKKR